MNKLSLKTNFNNKLHCSSFIHVSIAPAVPVPESKLGQLYQVFTEDGSFDPVEAQLLYFNRFSIGEAIDAFTIPSHGMDAADFIQWYLKENPTADYTTQLAAYYYKKTN
jgi:hypothetical protein